MEATPQTILDQAQREVAKLLSDANDEIAQAIQEAEENANKLGAEQARSFSEKLSKLEATILSEQKNEIVRTALDIAALVLRREQDQFPDRFVQFVQTAIGYVREAAHITLRVNPADAKVLRSHKDRLLSDLERAKDLEIREDKQVERGGVVIHTESGIIDAQLTTKLQEIANALLS